MDNANKSFKKKLETRQNWKKIKKCLEKTNNSLKMLKKNPLLGRRRGAPSKSFSFNMLECYCLVFC